jgi:hypothetical protein
MLIFWTVVFARFFVPLLIPRYPLPGVVAALVIDGIDQTVFQQFTTLDLAGYQGYDKALDIYYLTIAYITTLRNWTNLAAFQVSRFLFYWRLVGVTLFEMTHLRPLLMIFPNTFEYFFIYYEAYAVRWNPTRMSKRLVFGAAAFIWIVIKLPQEYWIHIAQMDATDFIKEDLLGMPTDAPWSEVISANLPVFVVAIALIAGLLYLAYWYITRRQPPADYPFSFESSAHMDESPDEHAQSIARRTTAGIVDGPLFEKVAMVALVSMIFAKVLPDVQASNLELAVGVAFVIVLNSVVSHWMATRGVGWDSALREFVVMAAVNFGLVLLYSFLLPRVDGSVNILNTGFFVLMLTLLVTLYDRYRVVYDARFATHA